MTSGRQRIGLMVGLLFLAAGATSTASLTDSEVHPPPDFYSFVPPPVGQSYVDPVFGETVVRGTDALNMAGPGPFEYLSAEYASSL